MDTKMKQEYVDDTASVVAVGGTVVGIPLVLTAIRCTLQYVLVPFLLPLIGANVGFSPLVNMFASFAGLALIIYNLIRLWDTAWRRRYLVIALFIVPFITVSIYFDYVLYMNGN